MKTKKYCCVLTIAGTDPTSGAGIQADLKTFAALQCYGLSVITALVAQNTFGVQAVHAVPAEFVETQLESVFQDVAVNVVKIGMLHNTDAIEAVAACLEKYKPAMIVIDPVMVAKDGSLLLKKTAISSLINSLFPLATLITPNLIEAEYLLQQKITTRNEMEFAAKKLASQNLAVLIKGGHLVETTSADCLYIPSSNTLHWFESLRLDTINNHGTGCTLSSAIAAHLANGMHLVEAVEQAKAYLFAAMQAGADYQLGQGHGPVHHLYCWWK